MNQKQRPEFAALDNLHSDVLIIGGGINGIAVMRDLALQGVSVTLVDKGDVMAGASAASSHMIHGGIRYLENGEFRLVRESVQERNDLLRTAPHVVKPLRTTIPIFSLTAGLLQAPLKMMRLGSGKKSERGALLIGLGLAIYETFSRGNGALERFSFVGRRRARQAFPSLRRGVKYVATYFDASVHEPERLALDLVQDALATENARVVTYVAAVGTGGNGVILEDQISGQSLITSADVVINASGPLTDLTNDALGKPTAFMGGTKGSHIVVDQPEMFAELAGRELFFENSDGRIVLIYPVKNRVLIGTTDIFADPSEPAVCTDEEVDYFFELVKHIMPGIHLDRSHIVFRFSGIRPLPRQDVDQPGLVSRDYRIVESQLPGNESVPLLSVVGGKWTTFRALGEHVSSLVLGALGRKRSVSTLGYPIGGGKDYPSDDLSRQEWIEAVRGSIPPERVEVLLGRYGTKAREFVETLIASGDTPLETLPNYSVQEITRLVSSEFVVHLDDVLLRRTSLAFSGELSVDRVAELAAVVGVCLGWDVRRREAETARAWEILATRHGVTDPEGNISRRKKTSPDTQVNI